MNTTLATAIEAARLERQAVIEEAAAEGLDRQVAASGYVNAERLREVLNALREARAYQPQVGDGMSAQYPQDRYPYVITRVSPSGKTVWVKPLRVVDRSTGHEPARYDGPFPIWDHDYTVEERQTMVEDVPERRVTRSRDGLYWTMNGTPMLRGANYRRNYSH